MADHPDDAPPIPPDRLAAALIAIYTRAQRDLERQISTATARGATGTARVNAAQLAAVGAILARLRRQKAPLEHATIAATYRATTAAVDHAEDVLLPFGRPQERAADLIAREMTRRTDFAVATLGRRAGDAFRRAGLVAAGRGVAAGFPPSMAAPMMTEQLRRDGITAFVDRAGRRWPLEVYAAMVARTTTREAVSAATAARLLEHGDHLITISKHPHPHDLCSPYEGRTWALPGTADEQYPTIDRLPPFHPNCKHVAHPSTVTFERFATALREGLSGAPSASAA